MFAQPILIDKINLSPHTQAVLNGLGQPAINFWHELA
jgi:hypothetical protein